MLNQAIYCFQKTNNIEFDNIIITFPDQNSRPLEIEDKVNLALLLNKLEMTHYSIEPRSKKYFKGYGFLLLARNLSNKYGKILLDTATKTRLDVVKTTFRKVVHKTTETTGELIENKIVEKVVKPKPIKTNLSNNEL